MAGLADIIKGGIAIARSLTLDLHVTVQHYPWIAMAGDGTPTYGAAVPRKALVERKQKLVSGPNGQMVMSNAYIAILEEVAPDGASGRVEPIDVRDKIVMPDGVTGPILNVGGFFDGGTAVPYYAEIYLG